MKRINVIVLTLFLLSSPGCTPDKTVVMTGHRSEGLTTATITFFSDGSYSINDETFLTDDKTKGEYRMEGNLITLSVLQDNSFLKSNRLLLKKDTFNNITLYQLDKNEKVDTTLLEFNVNLK